MNTAYGLIGKKLAHSFSPSYFNKKFKQLNIQATYAAFELDDIKAFPDLISAHPNLKGLNVTIPYKESVIPYLDDLDKAASKIGAVNCIKIEDGKLIGYNTDWLGFKLSLERLFDAHHVDNKDHIKAIVFGNGGASKAVRYALEQLDISYLLVSRSQPNDFTYENLDSNLLLSHRLLINTTPIGMYPLTEESLPISYQNLTQQHILYDLIYNPEKTKFLLAGEKKGCIICNGLEMLHIQAEEGYSIWNNQNN